MSKDDKMREIIRNRLIECRREHNLSQIEVGKIVGKSKNAVGSWEQGLSLPDLVTLYRLAKYYEKSLEYMYGEEKLLGENALQAIRENKMIGVKALDQLCSLLDLQPGDIIEYRKEE